ncbi:DUF397 domain-containing protein [Dactylosporangium sp. NPDC051541]|uniref:DUF397 domain-containing protein n=1 Tax=Dactylosporangium sp. NPDC051541 TaxID=3363977 RepID=UPI003794EA79
MVRAAVKLYGGRVAKEQSLDWRKSSLCEAGNCIEVAWADTEILIRDSQRPEQVLQVSRSDWDAFASGVARGDFAFA